MGKRVCTFCVMDTSDPEIQFDETGRCDQCRTMESGKNRTWFVDDSGRALLEQQLEAIRDPSAEFDCVLGLSGGVDSSYVALRMKEWGLRPLVVHVDAGWNSELAVKNIESLLNHCGWELHTHVVDWEDMRRLQVAYLCSGVANQDVPQDHAFFATLYHFATENGIRVVISGGNTATEGIMLRGYEHAAMDARNLKDIWAKFGDGDLVDYPTVSFFQYYAWYPWVKRMRTFRPLNLIPYRKADAIAELEAAAGWRNYERKHGESLFTKVYQNYYLPTRYGIDKRRPHLSSLIVSGQLTRDEALAKLSEPLCDPDELRRDVAYLCRKLRISTDEFEGYLRTPNVPADRFKTWDRQQAFAKWGQHFIERISGRRIRTYS